MNSRWKKYLIYASLITVGGSFIFILIETMKAKNTGFETKSLWDWMELLIIPLVLAIGAFFLNRSERTVEREIAANRQREDALQNYLDRMADLLLRENLRTSENDEVKNVARTRTLTVLRGLDGMRKGIVVRFLYGAKLIDSDNTIVQLTGADLRGVDLRGTLLMGANFEHTNMQNADLFEAGFHEANLSHVDLRNSNIHTTIFQRAFMEEALLSGAIFKNSILSEARLRYAILTNADLRLANLERADLVGAQLQNANLADANLANANLGGAKLQNANLSGAQLPNVNLHSADLKDANFYRADVINEQLAKAKSLKGAIMPDGTKHD